MTPCPHGNRRVLALIPLVTVVSIVLLAVAAMAVAADPSSVASVNATNGIALKGYDPVAYFTTGHATNGRDAYTYRWKEVTYRFASAEHRDRFVATPETYLPQYGGYCAFAMAISMLLLGALTLVRERERGSWETWETLLATPVEAGDALLGKLAPTSSSAPSRSRSSSCWPDGCFSCRPPGR